MLSAADCGLCCFIGRDASVGEEALRWFDECSDESSVGVLLGNVCGHGCKCSSKAEVLGVSGTLERLGVLLGHGVLLEWVCRQASLGIGAVCISCRATAAVGAVLPGITNARLVCIGGSCGSCAVLGGVG